MASGVASNNYPGPAKPQGEVFLPYGRHGVDESDLRAVMEVLGSDYLTQGPAIGEFETGLATATGSQYAVAVANGTAGLHLAMLALHLEKGSRGITQAITFVASANAMAYAGIEPSFCDVEAKTGLMAMDDLEVQLQRAQDQGRPIRVVVPVHFAGQPCDMRALFELKKRFGFFVVEDACHALGGRYSLPGSPAIGSLSESEMTVLSFHPVKHIATGEGGAVLTNDETLWRRLLSLRSHGIVRSSGDFYNVDQSQHPDSGEKYPWYYEMQDLGFNYRMPDILAALGSSQLKRLTQNVGQRRALALRYQKLLSDSPYFTPLYQDCYGVSSCHLQVLIINDPRLADKRCRLMNLLIEQKIGTQVHYIPVTMQPYYQKLGHSTPQGAAEFYRRCITVPLFPAMNESDVDRVVKSLHQSAKAVLEEVGP